MQKNTCVAFLFVTTLTAGLLQAQITYPHDKKWEFSAFGGAGLAGSETAATPVIGSDELRVSTLDYSGGYVLGLRISENLGAKMGAELEYSFADHSLAMLNVRPSVPRLPLNHYAHNILYSIVYYPRERSSRVRPFVGFGAGTTLYQISGDSKTDAALLGIPLKDTWKFAYGFTGGVKAMINADWGFRVEARNIWTGTPTYGLPSTATITGPGFAPSGVMNRWQLTAGFSYYWGR